MRTERIIEEIGKSNLQQIDEIFYAALERKRELYPEWEIFYCAAERGKINGVEDMLRAAQEFLGYSD